MHFFDTRSWARDDLAEYRAGYPSKPDRAELDRNVRFYRNELACKPEGIKIDDLHREWHGDYSWLERCHSYIQWLFPIQESGLNPQAQVLQKHEIATMRADPAIVERVKRSFALMLDFYGFRLADSQTGAVERKPVEWEERFENLNYSGHNYLRITRMLKFLGELGLESFKINWLLAFEKEIYDTGALPNCRSSFESYWIGTLYNDEMRHRFMARYKSRPAPEFDSYGRRRTSAAPAAAARSGATASQQATSSASSAVSASTDSTAPSRDGAIDAESAGRPQPPAEGTFPGAQPQQAGVALNSSADASEPSTTATAASGN